MIEWISETFSLLLNGANQLLTALLRLGLVFIALLIIGACIRAVVKNPKNSLAMVLFFTLAMIVGFGIPLLTIKYSDNGALHIISAVAGLVAAMKTIGLGERFYGDKSEEA